MTTSTIPWRQGPATVEWDLYLQAANEAKLTAAITRLEDRWVLARTRKSSSSSSLSPPPTATDFIAAAAARFGEG